MVHVAMPHILKGLLLSRCCVGMGQGTFGLIITEDRDFWD